MRTLFLALFLLANADSSSASDDRTDATLAHHLATNAVARAKGFGGGYFDIHPLVGWGHVVFAGTNMVHLTNVTWSQKFWLKGVRGLSATCIGFSNRYSGQGLFTMVSPRHCVFAKHMHPGQETIMAAFLDTNNVVHWRTLLETAYLENDIAVGILNKDLPPSVGFVPVVPTNILDYLPKNEAWIQGVGMNQDLNRFSQPMLFSRPSSVFWSSNGQIPGGLGTNWGVTLRGGDSSNPEMLLVGDQLVLVSHNFAVNGGPSYALSFAAINEKMRQLSIHNKARTDYQLAPFSLTNWPSVL